MPDPPKTWFQAAVYLSLAALAAKGMSALYKIPYQNITGDTGFYVYQQVYPLYGAALVLGTYGFPLVIAKAVASHEKEGTLREHLSFYVLIMFIFFSLLGTAVIAGAPLLASLMGDEQLTGAIRWMGAPFFLVPFFAAARGYYQGKQTAGPAAVSHVAEQFVRVLVILASAWTAMQTAGVYEAGRSAGIGAFAGGLAGLFVLWLFVKKEPYWYKLSWKLPPGWPLLSGNMLKQGLFVSASAMILVLFQVVDAFTIVRQLPDREEAAGLKGIYDRSWPLIQFGAVVTTVFSYAVIPSVTKAWYTGRRARAAEEATKAMKVCIVFGGAATVGMAALMPSVNVMMFTDGSGTEALRISAVVVLTGSVFMTGAALMYAIGREGAAFLILAGAAGIKAAGNLLLIPDYGISGAAAASAVAGFTAALTALIYLAGCGCFRPFSFYFWLKTGAAFAVMAAFVLLLQEGMLFFLDERSGAAASTLFLGFSGALLFIILIWRMQVFTEKEWNELPKMHKILPYRH
jgi:polysaccharide transporter, PST family